MANEYVVGAPLRTGLRLPATRYWGLCKVVVQRPHAQKDSFTVRLSQNDLADATNDCLWGAVTARVPFRTWEKVEILAVVKDRDIVQGRRRVYKVTQWPFVRTWTEEPEIDASEECARDQFADVQNELLDDCIRDLGDQTQDWTIVIYCRPSSSAE